MMCRKCGTCCTAMSISSFIPGMPNGKKAGVPCAHLKNNICTLFNSPNRPKVCLSFKPNPEICGQSPEEARELIQYWERETSPVWEHKEHVNNDTEFLRKEFEQRLWRKNELPN
jgi:Fe-S-cluster containining protein